MRKLMNLIAAVLCVTSAQAVEFDYDVNADGTITLKGVRGSVPADLVIPSEIDGRTVTGIGAKAFAGEIDLDRVFIPETVTSVGAGAFCGESKNYPKSNESFGVKEIFVEKGNTRFSMASGMLYDNVDKTVVAANSGISGRVVLPMGCEVVGDSAFQAKHFITEVVIPLSLRRLRYKAFSECSGLTRFDCSSSSLELIGEKCFKDSWNISRFDFPKTLLWIAEKALSSDAALHGKKTALKEIVFAGGVPEVQGDLYPYDADATTYVFPDMGWDDGVEIGTWQGRPIRYVDADPLDDLPVFVPGEKVSLAIPALIGYTAKKLPSGLKLNKKTGEISGAAKKPTGETGVTVTFTKKNEPTLTAQFVVGPIPTINVTLEGDIEKCKVTGANKAYLVGKKVSLQAKGPKGTAFVGWFKDGEPWPSEEEFLEPKIKYVMTSDSLNLVARFKAEEVSVACDTSTGCVVKEDVSFPVVVNCESGLKSISAKKLPCGLKYNKKTGCIEGKAKKAGTYPFSLTVTTKAGSKVTQSFTLAVRETMTWWAGIYSGVAINWCEVCDEPPDCGPWKLNMKVSISANGTVTGDLWDNGPDYGILKNGRKISDDGEISNWTVELWWYEDGRCMTPSVGTMTISSKGVLEYYDNDDANPDEKCPVQATLKRKK